MSSASGSIAWPDLSVKNCIKTHSSKAKAVHESGKEVLEMLGGIAEILQDNKKEAELLKLLEIATQVAKDNHHIQKHRLALSSFRYIANGQTTDFRTTLTQLTQSIHDNHPFDPARDDSMILLREKLHDDTDDDEPQDELIDEDIMIEGGHGQDLAKNTKCPITMRVLIDIEEPVEDRLGFVYEKSAIFQMFRNQQSIQCPVAGTAHVITKDELVPARAVIHAKRRAAKKSRRARPGVTDDNNNDEHMIEV